MTISTEHGNKNIFDNHSGLFRQKLDVVRVANLPLTTSREQLHKLFAQYGEVHSVSLLPDEDYKRSGCCGWVYMRQAKGAVEALHQTEFNGKRLEVKFMGVLLSRKDTVEADQERIT